MKNRHIHKKILLLLMIALPAMFATGRAYAQEFTVDGIKYNITSSDPRTVEVVVNSPIYSGNIVIPESVLYDGDGKTYAVTAIGDYAFANCTGLTSVTIPNSISSIGNSAFSRCSGLTSVMLPNSISSIETGTFLNCNGLTSINIPHSVTEIKASAFMGCIGLKSVTIPNSVTKIGNGVFGACSRLAEIYVKAEAPPGLSLMMFPFHSGILSTALIYVPCGKLAAYQDDAGWKKFTNIIEGLYSITLSSNDDAMGAVEKIQAPACANDHTAVIGATALPGYHFVEWNDGVTSNPRNVTVTQDTSFTAAFAENVSPVLLQDLEDAVVCRGESHTFKIVVAGENLSYEWYYGNERIAGANTNSYTVSNAEFRDYERYFVIVRSRVGESRVSVYSKNVRLWVADYLPETLQFAEYPSTAITGQSYRIRLAGYSDVTQYGWNYDRDGVTFSPATGGVGENETRATFGILSEGLGTLTVTLTHPCGTRQVTQAIVVNYPAGTGEVTVNEIAVSPNPTTGIIKVSGTKANQIIRILDIAGSLKGKYFTQEGETTIDLSGFTKGTYLVQYGGRAFKIRRQ